MASKPPRSTVVKGAASAESSPTQQTKLQSLVTQPQPQFVTMDMLKQAMQEFVVKVTDNTNVKTEAIGEKIKEVSEKVEEVNKKIDKKNMEIRQDILFALTGLSAHVENMDIKIEKVIESEQTTKTQMAQMHAHFEEKFDKSEADITIMQYRDMEFAVRIRGVKEERGEELFDKMAVALTEHLNAPEVLMKAQIDKIYRVNSWVARQKRLPRDIVIYFIARGIRNQVLQATFEKKLLVEGQEVMVMKEIPPKMLRARRDYHFLVEELRKHNLQYRWDVPAGIVVTYMGQRYRLNTVYKAREFYSKVFRTEPPPEGAQGETQETQGTQAVQLTQEDLQEGNLIQIEDRPLEQRQTRLATARRKEEELKQIQLRAEREVEMEQMKETEAVGGARPKVLFKDFAKEMLERLQGPGDV